MDYSMLHGLTPEYKRAVAQVPVGPLVEHSGLMDRSLGYLLGAVPSAAEGITKAIGNVGGFDGSFLDSKTEITPATDTSGKIVDFLGNLLPIGLQFAAGEGPVAAISEATGLAKAAPVVSNIAKQAAGFGAIGLEQDKATGAEEAGAGALIGASHALPWQARLPAAIGLGLLSKSIFESRHPEAGQGNMALYGTIAQSIFHPRVGRGKIRPTVADPFATVANEPVVPSPSGHVETPYVPPVPVAPGIPNLVRDYSQIGVEPAAYAEPASPIGIPAEIPKAVKPIIPDAGLPPEATIVPPKIPPKPTLVHDYSTIKTEGQLQPSDFSTKLSPVGVPAEIPRPAPVPQLPVETVEPPPLVETAAEKYRRNPTNRPPLKYGPDRIGEWGGLLNSKPELPNPVLPADLKVDTVLDQLIPLGTRAIVGGAAGAIFDDKDRVGGALAGAAIGIIGPKLVDAVTEGKHALKGKLGKLATVAKTEEGSIAGGGGKKMEQKASPHDFVPALLEKGKTEPIIGQKGEVHNDIKKRQTQDWQDANVLADVEGQGAQHGFWNGKKFVTRDEASTALGLKEPLQSETLRDLQSLQTAPAIEKQSNSFFATKAFEGIEGFKSKSKVFYMPIKDFLALAHPLVDLTRKPAAAEVASKEIKWSSLPQILIDKGKVISHEGRNRAEYLQSKGMEYLPVEIRDTINRWDEMSSEDLPKELLTETKTGFKIPFELKARSEIGSVIPELSSYMTRAAVGGLIGGTIGGHYDSNGDNGGFIAGAMLGAAVAAAGPEVGLAMMKKISDAKLPPPAKGLNEMGVLKKTFEQKVEEKAGNVIHGSTLTSDRLINWLDKSFNITMPESVSRTLRVAEGTATHMLDTMDAAMRKLSVFYKAPKELRDQANAYLDGAITQDQFLQPLQNDADRLYANYVVAARQSIDGLQRMIESGIGSDTKSKLINESLGKYVTRSFKLFTRDNWTPEPSTVDALAAKLKTEKAWENASSGEIKDYLYSYIREVNSQKGMYRGAATGNKVGESIDQRVLKPRENLNAEWRAFLGEITNPTERISQTLYRLRPMSAASKFMHDIAKNMTEDGMPHYFQDRGQLDAFKAKTLQSLQTATSDSAKSSLQGMLTKLDNFQPLESLPKYGELRGGLVSRNVWNTLSTFDSVTGIGSHPWMRSISGLNVAAKLSNTALNPISFVRNVFQIPMMMAIGRASMNDVFEGLKVLHDPEHPLHAELISQGIGSVDQLKQEIFRDFNTATEGKYNFSNMDWSNLSIGRMDADAVRKGFGKFSNKYLDIYRSPDNAVRIGTYLSAKRRIAEALGKDLNDPIVIQKATDFTNRYTMDYGAVAPIIKNVRQIPGVNLYISYISEMTRITKNIMEDLLMGKGDGLTAHGRLYAAMPVAFLGALPEIMNQQAEAGLSPKDRSDWEKAKSLMPDYARTRYRASITREADGNFKYVDFTPLIPTDFIHQSVKAAANGDWSALLATNPIAGLDNSPALNIVIEQATKQDLHTHRDFRGFQDRVASAAKEILPPWVSIGREGRRYEQSHTPTEFGDLGYTNLRTGQRLTPEDFWFPYKTALRSGSYNLTALEQQYTSEVKRDIANNSAYLNDILKSDASDEIKNREKVKFAKIQGELLTAWQQKLGLLPPVQTNDLSQR